jgi:hypothetical protein
VPGYCGGSIGSEQLGARSMIEPPGRSSNFEFAATKLQITKSDLTDHYEKEAEPRH